MSDCSLIIERLTALEKLYSSIDNLFGRIEALEEKFDNIDQIGLEWAEAYEQVKTEVVAENKKKIEALEDQFKQLTDIMCSDDYCSKTSINDLSQRFSDEILKINSLASSSVSDGKRLTALEEKEKELRKGINDMVEINNNWFTKIEDLEEKSQTELFKDEKSGYISIKPKSLLENALNKIEALEEKVNSLREDAQTEIDVARNDLHEFCQGLQNRIEKLEGKQ